MINIQNTKNLLQEFDFKKVFIEELGWSNPTNRNTIPFKTKAGQFSRKAIAELSGAIVYEISTDDGSIPDSNTRAIISQDIQKINHDIRFTQQDCDGIDQNKLLNAVSEGRVQQPRHRTGSK